MFHKRVLEIVVVKSVHLCASNLEERQVKKQLKRNIEVLFSLGSEGSKIFPSLARSIASTFF